MLEQKTMEKEINAYLLDVDAVLKSKGLLKMKGSSELDKVQKEVEATLDQMRAIGRAKGSTNDMRRVSSMSLKRVKWFSDKLRFDRKAPQAAMFGSLSDRGMLGNPAWKSAFTSVAGAVSDFTNAYGRTIANMDQYSRTTIDQTLADLINKAETCYANEPSDLGAQRYLQSSMATIAQLKQSMSGRQQKSAQEMLKIAVQTKDQQRVTLLSNAKLLERNASAEQMSVINTANRRAMEKLNAMLTDSSSYDTSIRSQKMKLIDSDLAMMERTIAAIRFSDELGKRAPPPHTAHGRLGHLNNEQKKTLDDVMSNLEAASKMHANQSKQLTAASSKHATQSSQLKAASKMHKKDAGALRRHFRDASAKGSGGLSGFKTLDLANTNDNQIFSAVNNNLEHLRITGKLTPGERLHLESQIDSLSPEMYTNQAVYNESIKTYKDTLTMSNLGGIFKLDSPELSRPNWARLFNTGVIFAGLGWLTTQAVDYWKTKGLLLASERSKKVSERKRDYLRSKF